MPDGSSVVQSFSSTESLSVLHSFVQEVCVNKSCFQMVPYSFNMTTFSTLRCNPFESQSFACEDVLFNLYQFVFDISFSKHDYK